jgi:hypothetical protein
VFLSEIHKWHNKMPMEYQNQFVITKEKVAIVGKEGFQFASLVTASAEHEENLQGGHSDNYVILADEASGIEEKVFDVLLGTLSTGNAGRFVMTSNPLRSSGRFYEVFARDLSRWTKLYFSAYDSPVINKQHIEDMKEQYGDDSDIFRVRILGRFPRASSTAFFSTEDIDAAVANRIDSRIYSAYPITGGVDVARFGDDKTVFITRQGPKVIDITKYAGLNNMEVVAKLVEYHRKWNHSIINIDAIGVGTGVYDRSKELRLPVHPVVVSQKSTEPMQYLNLRAQLYGLCREWLQNGADIPKDVDVIKQFNSMEYGFNKKMQIQMMGKKEIKAKGLESPDIVDAICLTFAGEAIARIRVGVQAREIKVSSHLWV